MKFNSILETVGNTPCVKINNLAPEGVELYVKAEYFIIEHNIYYAKSYIFMVTPFYSLYVINVSIIIKKSL